MTEFSATQQQLLQRLVRGGAGAAQPRVSAIPRHGTSGPVPLSYSQEAVWLVDKLAADVPVFNLVMADWLHPDLPLAAFQQALQRIAARHDALRMALRTDDGAPRLEVSDDVEVEVVELTATGPDPVAAAQEAALVFAARPYRLDQAPLWRAGIVVVSPEQRLAVIGAHHLAMDATSLALVGGELAGTLSEVDPPIGFADFAVWQRAQLEHGAFHRDLDYWRSELADLPQPLQLPADRPRPAARDLSGGTVQCDLPSDAVRRVRQLARTEGVTTYMVMLATYSALLHQYSSEEDLVIGSTLSGRNRPELQRLVGMFVNMVAIRASLQGSPTFRELLRQLRAKVFGALEHQGLPYDVLIRELRPSYGRNRPPLAQVGFNMPVGESTETPKSVPLPVTPQGSQLDLTLHVVPTVGGGIRLELEYATALFDRETAAGFLEQFASLVGTFTTDPSLEVKRSAHGGSAGGDAAEESEGRRDGPTLPDLFTAQIRSTPDAVALVDGGRTLTYAQLRADVERMSARLRLPTEARVGVYLERGADAVVSLLAIWRAGCCYVPLDPSHPISRVRHLMGDAGVVAVLTTRALASRLEGTGTPVVCVDEPAAGTAEPRAVRPGHAAYLMYTSGSTGAPKGVVITHAGIANRARWPVEANDLGPGDRVLNKTSLTFDASVWEMISPLVGGATVVIGRPGIERDPQAMLHAVAAQEITVLQVVPSVLRRLIAAEGWAACTRLRSLYVAGEPLDAELCTQVRSVADVAVINTYGPTECSIDVTAHRWDPRQDAGPVPIGTVLDGMRVFVLDSEGNPVPPFAIGELHVGGAGVARGYAGLPNGTAQRFVPSPFGPPGERLYRTGDLVRVKAGGVLEFVGRVDEQVKVNGVRVEPAEVERALLAHPAVRAGAVVARLLPDGGKQLVAFVVADGELDQGELRAHMRGRLPEAMGPAAFARVDALPLTASGKVDRAALRERGVPGTSGTEHTPPRDDAERTVADAWKKLLELDDVSVYDDFFALGGHSLQMALLTTRLSVDVPLTRFFAATTVAAQARLLREPRAASDGTEGAGPSIPRVPRKGALPASSGQQRIWMAERLRPGSPAQLVPVVLDVSGTASLAEVRSALARMVARHEILRTRYELQDRGLRQVVDPPFVPEVEAAAGTVPEQIARLAAVPFDLATGPVLRGRLVRAASGGQSLVLVVHHIAWDGASTLTLATEFEQAIEGVLHAEPARVQYADFAAWQASRAADREPAELAHWGERLAGASATELPADLPRPPVWQGNGESFAFAVAPDTAAELERLGRSRGATPFMAFLAAFNGLLAAATGDADVVVGTPAAGRPHRDVTDLIGYFANLLVLRTQVGEDSSFLDLLEATRQTALEAYVHQDVPFDRVVDSLRTEHDRSRNPLFQVMFEVTQEPPSYLRDAAGSTDPADLIIPWPTAMYDLTVTLVARPDGGYLGIAEFATDLYRRSTVEQLMRRYVKLLASLADASDAPLGELLAEEQVAPRTLPEVLARQAAVRPDAFAVEQDGERLTYAELARRVRATAGALRFRGVTPGALVAGCLPRSVESVVTALGAMWAGAGYVPLDPAAPPRRLAEQTARVRPSVLVMPTGHAGTRPYGVPVFRADELAAPELPEPAAAPDALAYVVHTSGSTGDPNGVMVDPVVYLKHCESVLERYGLTGADRVLTTSPPFVDVMLEHLGMVLVAGATLVLAGPQPWSPAELPGLIAARDVTYVDLPPVAWRDMVARLSPGDPRLAGLRVVNIGTDVVRGSDVHRWLDLRGEAPGARFLASYGPTEAVVTSTLHEPSAAEARHLAPQAIMPIGTEVAPAAGYVLGPDLRAAADGEVGELHLAGSSLARGYLHRPALTAERFVPDPFSTEPNARMYRTGDLVSRRADGVLDFHGRADRQAKVNGYRIEPTEVEGQLSTHPGVHAAAVVEYRGELAAYVVADEPAPAVTELRVHLRNRLPAYMVPRYWRRLDELPLTPGGKVNARSLPPMAPEIWQRNPEPDDGVSGLIWSIWQEVLQTGDFGNEEDFFELGGNSLMATRVHMRLRDLFGVGIPLGEIFENTTVRQQSDLVTAAVTADVMRLGDGEVAALLRDAEAPLRDSEEESAGEGEASHEK